MSEEILEGILQVLETKFNWSARQLSEVKTEIKILTIKVTPVKRIKVVKDDPEDDKMIETAVESQSQVIISGDQHLLTLGKYQNIKILTAREFLDKL